MNSSAVSSRLSSELLGEAKQEQTRNRNGTSNAAATVSDSRPRVVTGVHFCKLSISPRKQGEREDSPMKRNETRQDEARSVPFQKSQSRSRPRRRAGLKWRVLGASELACCGCCPAFVRDPRVV